MDSLWNDADTPTVKIINDPIHGHFEIPQHVLEVVDTPHVQRLRDLKQLGGVYLVYPGASHNRFEHSLGVSHLSGDFVTKLYRNPRDKAARQQFENERGMDLARSLIQIAGVVHDLGHGPFSHMFDYDFLPNVPSNINNTNSISNELMHHEERSCKLFEHCVDTYNLDIEHEHVNIINNLIKGNPSSSSIVPKFLFQVVSNNQTGIDTDKFDYLQRDVYNLGLGEKNGFDYRRLMFFTKVVNNNICFHKNELFNVYELFHKRYQLHRAVYSHRAALSIDAMLTDAFLEADHHLKISESVQRPQDFILMTDSLIPIIELSKEAELKKARHIIHRLRRRKLYRFVDEHVMPSYRTDKIRPHDITTCQDSSRSGVHLIPEDIHVKMVTLHFGMKEKNPVDKVLFFEDWEDEHPVRIRSETASCVIPSQFQDNIVRVYMKREAKTDEEDDQLKKAVSIAFRNYLKRHDLTDDDHTNRYIDENRHSESRKRTRSELKHVSEGRERSSVLPVENSLDGIEESGNAHVSKRERPNFNPML